MGVCSRAVSRLAPCEGDHNAKLRSSWRSSRMRRARKHSSTGQATATPYSSSIHEDPVDLRHEASGALLTLPAEVVAPVAPVGSEDALRDVSDIRLRVLVVEELGIRSYMDRGRDRPWEIRGRLKRQVDLATREAAARDDEPRDESE